MTNAELPRAPEAETYSDEISASNSLPTGNSQREVQGPLLSESLLSTRPLFLSDALEGL